MKNKVETLQKYYTDVKKANTELAKKELLKNLLVRLFDTDARASKVIETMSLGQEKTIFKIPLKDRLKTGSADTQYGNVIIEFEKSIQSTGKLNHAVEQLQEYLAGNWKSKGEFNFTLIATDCITWKIYALDSEKWIYNANSIFTASDVALIEKDNFVLTEKNLEDFPAFLDRYLFKLSKLPATLENIKNEFGEKSETFITALKIMTENYSDLSVESEIKTSFDQWEKFLSLAYGKFTGNTKVFLVHTYLSVFSKILAYSILSKEKEFIEDNELEEILTGKFFDTNKIENFVDNDFYYWITIEKNYKILRPVFRKILQTLENFDFTKIEEDILKGVYQELIDIETRHKLGEYYTPDWLCNEVVGEFDIKRDSRFLDPACGSGSFVRAFISKQRKLYPNITVEEILEQVSGIDIHPLSVQIAKTNILLEISSKIKEIKKQISIKVYLANSLLVPEGVALFENQIIQNSFDFIGGNPPWLTYDKFSNAEYQEMQRKLAKTYSLVPSVENMPHLEIASIFLSHSSEKFLKPSGKIGFVLPRSFMSADQHKSFRSGESVGFKLTSVWDLTDVKPLFNVPAMVVFAEKCEVKTERKFPKAGIPGLMLSGRMNKEDKAQGGLWGDMSGRINKVETIWYSSRLGERTALSNKKTSQSADQNFYEPYFKQGATIVPRNFYFVDLLEELPKDKKDRIVVVKTAEHILADAKPPWKDFILKNQMNTNFLFRTAIAKSILPFQLVNPVLVALPIEIEKIGRQKQIKLLDSEKIASSGDFYSSKYFREGEKLWKLHSTEKSSKMTSEQRLNYQNGITGQNLNARYIVLYNSSGKDANTVVVDRKELNFEFIVESKTYWYATNSEKEAIYLCAFLNSDFANLKIKDFQSKGLFGARDVSKTILQVPLPEYNENNPLHDELVQVGTACIEKTKAFLKLQDVSEVSGIKLGSLRLKIKENLVKELKDIDKLLRKINKE